MKSKTLMMAQLAVAMMTTPMTENRDKRKKFIPDSKEDKLTLQNRRINLMIKRGLKCFYIDGHTIYARDKKNAIRKLDNIKKTLL